MWIALAIVTAVVLLPAAVSPTIRRLWAFFLYAMKYIFIWLADVTRLRWIWAVGGNEVYHRYTRPELLRLFCEDLGPTFIKFGQIVASSSGMFPKRYVAEFQKCLDRVRPFPFDVVETILHQELGDRAGRLSKLGEVPLASASIAQVHTAVLDGHTNVVVKVQRPGIASRIDADMKIMRVVAAIVARFVKDADLANPVAIVDDFSETLREELDFRKEGKNLDRFNEIMAGLGHHDVRAPRPYAELSTPRALVMERFYGTRVDDAERIRARGIDAEAQLVKGLRSWFQSVLFHGFFHGDVHAGNLMLLDDDTIGFLDFGIVGRFDGKKKSMVTDYIVAFAGGDYRGLAKVITDMGGVAPGLDMDKFAADLEQAYSPILKLKFSDINYAELLPQIQKVASKHRMRMPKEFVLITKQMLYFDRYAKLLAPNLNIFTDPRLVMSLMSDVARARAMQASDASASAEASAAAAN